MRHASLFTGIGGFDLAAQWAGWSNTFQVEIDPWCQRILSKNFPHVQRHTDIRTFDPTPYRHTIDIISGGFPCQPYSQAGQRKGKEDPRHLWPEMLRVIRTIQPRWVVGENVRGLATWSRGLVFEEVHTDLESAGYTVQAFILPAASVNAPHERQRIWFIAHANDTTCARFKPNSRKILPQKTPERFNLGNTQQTPPHPDHQRFPKQQPSTFPNQPRRTGRHNVDIWDEWTTEPPVCRMDDGIPHRVDRIRGLGNAIVPQLAWRIFDTINQYENSKNS